MFVVCCLGKGWGVSHWWQR